MKKRVYIFSGLGADERVFQKIDFTGIEPIFIEWIDPLKEESIDQYAGRLLDQITSPSPIIIGLSFGGIIAQEVAQQLPTEKIIIISSVKSEKELPEYIRFANKIGLYSLIPVWFLTHSNLITNFFFGVKTSSEKKLLKEILRETPPLFLCWAIKVICSWKGNYTEKPIYHVHGKKDRILPCKNITCNKIIEGGGHFMILNQAEIISQVFRKNILE